jgi:hypothetical protein
MARLTVAHAGCDEDVVKKLNIVANLFRGRGKFLNIEFWQGTGVDLVVANRQDAFGCRVADIARRKKLPVLWVSDEGDIDVDLALREGAIKSGKPAMEFFHQFERLLSEKQDGAADSSIGGIIQDLAQEKERCYVYTTTNGAFMNKETGFFRAVSHRDLLAIAEALVLDKSIRITRKSRTEEKVAEASTSIENLIFGGLVNSNFQQFNRSQSLSLSAWPDIKSRRYGGEIAALSAMLINATLSMEELETAAQPKVVSAFLFACRVAGLLIEAETDVTTQIEPKDHAKKPRTDKMLTMLKNWLGM